MKSLLQAGARVQAQLTARGFRFCFIGGVANFRWGTPRLTNALDLTVLSGFGGESPIIEALLNDMSPRIPDAVDFALRHRVLLLRTADGFAVDIALGAMPFEEGTVDRATEVELAPDTLKACSYVRRESWTGLGYGRIWPSWPNSRKRQSSCTSSNVWPAEPNRSSAYSPDLVRAHKPKKP